MIAALSERLRVCLAALCLAAWLAAPAAARLPGTVAVALGEVGRSLEAAQQTMLADPAKASELAREAESAARRLPPGRERLLAVAKARWLYGEGRVRTGEPEQGRAPILSALKLIEPIREPTKLRGDLLMSRAGLQRQQGQAAAALASYQQAFKVFQQLDEKRSQSIALQNIALLYGAANDNARAERYFRQAGEVFDSDPPLSLSLRNNLGITLIQLERYREAEAQFLQARALARRMKSAYLEVRILSNLARAYTEDYDLSAAEDALAAAFRLTDTSEARDFRPTLLGAGARVAFSRGDIPRAARLIGESFAGVDLDKTTVADRDRHFFAYKIYSATGDSRLALAHLEALKRLTDEANKVATSTSAALMGARFDYANQELRIANLKAEELRRNVAFERDRARFQLIIFVALGAATLIVVALLGFGVVTLRRSRNEVRAANIDLASTNTALERALAAKTEFLATTSHEIRTPLNGILGMTQVMLCDRGLDPATRDRIGIVHGAGVTMRALVDDILDVAKMETGNLSVEHAPMDLHATLADVTRLWGEQARAKGLAFTLDCGGAPGWIESDAARLRQIVFNLLSNAIKFTEAGSVGVRAVEAEDEGGRRLLLSVTDSGIGIPVEKQGEIFESFRQVDAGTTRHFGGTGLGLTISRKLAVALGGAVRVESTPGQGSVFTVDLPLVVADAPRGATPETVSRSLLVLDRNPITRAMLKALLSPHAGDPAFAATAEEAADILARGEARLVLADEATLKAGEPDPLAALARLGQSASAASARMVLLWASPDAPVRDAAAAGAITLIEKPVAGPVLIAALFGSAVQNSAEPPQRRLVSHAA